MSDIIRSKQMITRKPHRCFGCGRLFPAGTEMQFSVVVDDVIFNSYLCESCQIVSQDHPFDEFCFGDLLEESLEYEKERKEKL